MKNLLSAALALLLMTGAAYAGGDDAHGNAKVSLFAKGTTVGDTAVAADSNGYIDFDLKAIGGNALTTALPVTGTFWQTTQPVSGTFWQATQPVSGTVTVTQATGTNLHAVLDSTSSTIVTQATAANLKAQVSVASGGIASGSVASGAVASGAYASGALAVGSIADGAEVTLGTKADAKNAATDTTAITAMSVLKEISSMAQAPASTPVTNAGTFAVQSTEAGTWNVTVNTALPAGTNLVGKVGIDQTTPGTTNGVQVNAALPAGSNLIGNVTEVPSATAGGLTPFTLTLAASTNATSIKASAGQLYSMAAFNMSSATPVWVSLYDNSGTPTCGTAIKAQFLIPGSTTGTGYIFPMPDPVAFASGIAMCATTGIAGTGSPAATTYVVNAFYK